MRTSMIWFAGLIFLLIAESSLLAQTNRKRVITYNVWIEQMGPGPKIRGMLYEIKDSTLVVANQLGLQQVFAEIPVAGIETIRLRKQKRVRKAATLGAAAGFAFGAAIAATSNSFTDNTALAIGVNGIFYGAAGALIGAGIGRAKSTIPIRGSLLKFREHKTQFIQYSYLGQRP